MRGQWIVLIACWWSLFACDNNNNAPAVGAPAPMVTTNDSGKSNFFQEKERTGQPAAFLPLLDSSYYKNRDSFTTAFQQHYQLSNNTLLHRQVTSLYGAVDSVFWLCFGQETNSSNCNYPLKELHFIFNHKGQLLYQKQVHSAQFLENAIDSTPIYLAVEHNCEGEGQHQAYILQEGQLVNVLNVLFENMPLTFDVKEDSSVFQGGALQASLKDLNQDGHPDLVLQGKEVQLISPSGGRFSVNRPYRRDRVSYHFLYEPAKEVFVFAPTSSH